MAQGLNRAKVRQHRAINRVSEIVILPITGGVDVFTGKGWDAWTRFDTTQGYPRKMSGPLLTNKDYQTVFANVTGRA
jgi:hypothetical protein